MDALHPWQHRSLALALLGMVALVLVLAIVRPIASAWRENAAWQGTTLRRIAEARGLLAQRGELERLQALMAQAPVAQRLLSGAPDAAAAQLQADFRSALVPPNLTIQNVQPLAIRDEGQVRRVAIQVSLSATIDQLTALLERIARAPRLYMMDNVQVTAPEYQDRASNPSLNVRFELSGYLMAEAAAP